MYNNKWIYNDHTSQQSIELQESIDLITHRIWINRNKKIFNTRKAMNATGMIESIAILWNTHIRAKIFTRELKKEEAIRLGQTITKDTHWDRVWTRIRNNRTCTPAWVKLQATEGEVQARQFLFNQTSNQLDSNKYAGQPLHRNFWRNPVSSQNLKHKNQKSTLSYTIIPPQGGMVNAPSGETSAAGGVRHPGAFW